MRTVDGKGRGARFRRGTRRAARVGVALASLVLTSAPDARAGDGDPDATFGTGGTVLLGAAPVDLDDDSAARVLALPDGRVLVAGSQHGPLQYGFALLALDASGAPDAAFGPLSGGRAVHAFAGATQPRALARRADGQLLVLFADKLARFAGDGSLVETRDALSLVGAPSPIPDLRALLVRDDGGVYVVGSVAGADSVEFVAVSLTAVGTPVAAFGFGGVARAAIDPTAVLNAAALAPDDGVLMAGSVEHTAPGLRDMLVVRFTPAGQLDARFGTGGRTTLALDRCGAAAQSTGDNADEATLIRATDGGTIMLIGRAGSLPCRGAALDDAIALARLDSCGRLDSTFGAGGVATLGADPSGGSEPTAALLQPDGATIVAGIQRGRGASASAFGFVARVERDGTLDATFGDAAPVAGVHHFAPGVGAESFAGDLAFAGGAIVVAGSGLGAATQDFAVRRLVNDRHLFADGFD